MVGRSAYTSANAANSSDAESPTAGAIDKPAWSRVLAITHERGLGHDGLFGSSACNSSGRKAKNARICSLMPAAWPYLRKSSRSASTSRCRNRFASGAGISKTLARSCLRLPAAHTNQSSGSTYDPTLRSRMSCCAIPCMVGAAMLSSSRNKMPAPSRGRNSGGNQVEIPSAATGKPRRSVGASWERRTSTKRRSCAAATWATMALFPTPGGPQIMAAFRTG